ncbi:MAG: hypothetical protein K6A23_07630 [Butyrivibrio sp.]|nr:hypothetical protein [Butyrivibrio sp.]
MSKIWRRTLMLMLLCMALCVSSFNPCTLKSKSYAADIYTTLSKATRTYNGVNYSSEYNPLYYYLNYPDLQAALGADGAKLIEHYVLLGKSENRVANRLLGNNSDYVVPTGKEAVAVIPIIKNHDNGGMTVSQEVQARSIAKQIADGINAGAAAYIESQKEDEDEDEDDEDEEEIVVTDVEKVAYAAGVVKAYCDRGTYVTTGQVYRTAYGVFVAGEYSCAGSTRALGLILDYLGISWEHANINQWADQWCRVVVDDQEGYADGIEGIVGYGKHVNDGGDGKSSISYKDVRKKFTVTK